jgi:hypothetical protein
MVIEPDDINTILSDPSRNFRNVLTPAPTGRSFEPDIADRRKTDMVLFREQTREVIHSPMPTPIFYIRLEYVPFDHVVMDSAVKQEE